ncbi:MAG: S8 family serine peptidase [Planctomycetes bacterium]|nr:S8 family serine peptidase [Planctomycetota bacterium]MCB9891924.1 S8 family serine peptidase [Planctomycetota bacterium]
MNFGSRKPRRLCLGCAFVLAFGALTTHASAQDSDKIDPWVVENTQNGATAEFLVMLAQQADLSPAASLRTKEEKGRFVYETLYRTAQATQGPLLEWLRQNDVPHRSFYIVNMVWVEGDRKLAQVLATREDVSRIERNPRVHGMAIDASPANTPMMPALEPNISYTGAPQVWAMGYTGQGTVVGGQDTGYQWDHPALIGQYRGWNGSSANHDYNWHDSIHSGGGVCGSNTPAPCDDHGHGTHTMGTVLGDDGGGNQIGMAPGALWICSRNMDQGNGTPATYMESFEFFLAPYPVGGTPAQGNPALAPDVTTNSWLCPPSEGCAPNSLLLAVQAQRAAGILTVIAAGNSGSSCSSVQDPPAIYDESYSIGAMDYRNGSIARFSSRGPVTIDGSGRTKPDLSAPGVGIRSSYPGSTYASGWSGTSMATPHVAGAVALLISAHPALRGQPDMIEQVLNDTAVPATDGQCGASSNPNNVYGHGILDVFAAVNAVRDVQLVAVSTSGSGAAGMSVQYTLTITNRGYLDDTFQLSLQTATFPASLSQTTVGPLAAGASANVTVDVQIPSGTAIGTADAITVSATSQAFALTSTTIGLNTTCNSACVVRNGNGLNPVDFACDTPPVLGTTWVTSYGSHAGTLGTVLAFGLAGPATGPGLGSYEFLIGLIPGPILVSGAGPIALPIPNDPSFQGAAVHTQGARADQNGGGVDIVLLNALDLVLGL